MSGIYRQTDRQIDSHVSCPSYYELIDDSYSCVETNECLANNGHGPCQVFTDRQMDRQTEKKNRQTNRLTDTQKRQRYKEL